MVNKKSHEKERSHWVEQMYDWGEKGISDFSHTANRIVTPTRKNVSGTGLTSKLRVLPTDHDVQGYDLPRPDINQYKSKTGKLVRVGNDAKANRGLFGSFFMPKLNGSFTEKEINAMNLYYEYPDAKINQFLGNCAYWESDDVVKNPMKFVIIGINRKNIKDEATLIHETIHASRYAEGTGDGQDEAKDEAYVELESIARVSRAGLMKMNNPQMLGYYSFLGKDGWNKLKEDRILLTGSLEKNLTGDAVHKRVKEVFPKSNISKLVITHRMGKLRHSHLRAGDWIDRFFRIEIPKGDHVELQIRLGKPVTTANIIKNLKKQYGQNITAWEWRNGKKYRITKPAVIPVGYAVQK